MPSALVLVHVRHYPDGAVYTVSIPRTPGARDHVGETHVVESWAAGTEAEAWAYACIHAVLAAVEHGYRSDDVTVRGDRADLGRLLTRDWPGRLGVAVRRYRHFFGDSVRFQNRAGGRFTAAELAAYRRILDAHLVDSPTENHP
jgi:hypothetical protein